ncbi:methyltransferase-like protein 25B [Neodiprion fabricii]|uniref:methyltransferase-like protein 25B n=1 Tax=Neodiprion fabricii TaxID=2872261 RepID=UPI001ED9544B|nr:methyltransferase-like protein 25B [Neodiprion fabricii]XP_046434642.1 methyltransferase-like protein 25B [Neodiprion fabricii]XP_046434643.1 methyltransferase-like protein 25B [Neodiprion fabricii]XP_046434644.1 methyltransferase-like protein 25B [Neodiprion fabricii]
MKYTVQDTTTMATVDNTGSGTCLCRICDSVRETVRQIFIVLDKYRWLLDAYIVDFYEADLWERLPGGWSDFFKDITPGELGSWILNEGSSVRVWPLSLQALRRVVGILQIHRNQRSEIALKCENVRKTENTGFVKPQVKPSTCSSHSKLRDLLGKHVKPKKKHEIEIMAKIIADCAASAKSECAVDVGAGIGHLARTLAYRHEMCIICVEQQSLLSEQARKLDTQFESIAMKYVTNIREQKPHHVSLKIERDSSELSFFMDIINKEFTEKFRLNPKFSGFGLIGLHPCGDLATTLLQSYVESDRAKFICVAGCCYMKLSLGPQSYPLSEYLRTTGIDYDLSYTALEVACHAVENHCIKLKSAECWELKIHAYRATLESLIVQRNSSLRHAQLKSFKLKENTTFEEYCMAVTENFIEENRPRRVEEIRNPKTAELLERWEQVVVFGSLRSMLAPLVESAVLLDRFLYLSEKNLSPKLKAVFDPFLSPRNFVLTSIK